MTDTPERVWINIDANEYGCCPVESGLDDVGKFFDIRTATEYVRADLHEVEVVRLKSEVQKAVNSIPISYAW